MCMYMYVHQLNHADMPAVQWLNITKMSLNEDSATVVVKWSGGDQNQDKMIFIVVITPPLNISLSNFTTNTLSYQTTIPYNCQHTITVSATNCIGNTSTLNKTFHFSKSTYTITLIHNLFLAMIVQCQQPNVTANISVNYDNKFRLEGSQAFFSCPKGQTLSNRKLISATCISNGMWSPNPSQLQCKSCNFSTYTYSNYTSDLYTLLIVGDYVEDDTATTSESG